MEGVCDTLCTFSEEDDKSYLLQQPDSLPVVPLAESQVHIILEPTLVKMSHHTNPVYGIDVSHYQGSINWDMVGTDENARYVYIKATESNSLVDKCYSRNLKGARNARIPVGVYHFFSPSTSPFTQLRNFLDVVNPAHQDLIPIVDVEKRGHGHLSHFQNNLSIFLMQLEKVFGVKPIIYTGVNFYNQYLAGRFTQYRFMIAKYEGEEPPTLVDDVPIIMWQFTCKGQINGIRCNVDRSCFVDQYGLEDILLSNHRATNR